VSFAARLDAQMGLLCTAELNHGRRPGRRQNGGSRTLLVLRCVTERGGGRLAVWLRDYFS